MDIYENIVVGNYLFGLGATIGVRHRARMAPPTAVNLLQQTPLDRPLGDVLLENSRAARLIEFKRRANDSIKEKNKLAALRAVLRGDRHQHLVQVSRSIHWYVETEQVLAEFKSRIVPYLDLDNQPAGNVSFEAFVEDTAEALTRGDVVPMKLCNQYIEMLQLASGSISTSSGGLIVVLTNDNQIKYAAIEEFRDLRLPIQQIEQRMNLREAQRVQAAGQTLHHGLNPGRSRRLGSGPSM